MSEMVNMAPPRPRMTREELTRAVAAGGRPTILAEHEASAPQGWSKRMHQFEAKPNTTTPSLDSETETIAHSGNGNFVMELRSVAERGSARTHIANV